MKPTMTQHSGEWEDCRFLSEKELLVVSNIDDEYAWRITEELSSGEMRAGTESSRAGAEQLATEMESLGLEPGAHDGFVEEFLVYGCEDLGTSVTLLSPKRQELRCKQSYQGPGTGPDGVVAPLVFANLGRWDDYERVDVRGKIVLLHRLDADRYFHTGDPFFYSIPAIAEAAARGALGVLLDYPINDKDVLKTDASGGSIPNVYVTSRDFSQMQDLLASGQNVTVRLVVQNKVGHYPTSRNVVGMIRGHRWPEEYVYLTAHFDHWFSGSGDDNAGVGSLLAVARAVKASQLEPQRTLVFCAWDSEETGGHPDTWYEWLIGSFSHIHATLQPDGTLGEALHPERRGRIAGMLNLDQIASVGSNCLIESTPDLVPFFRTAARDSGLRTLVQTCVAPPPGAYDDWSFYIAGVPCGNVSWWGAEYDRVYHTDSDTMENIDLQYLKGTSVFAAVSMLRLAESRLLPYSLVENVDLADQEIGDLLLSDRYVLADGNADVTSLRKGMADYLKSLQRVSKAVEDRAMTDQRVAEVNGLIMKSAQALNPGLFYWDVSGVLPPGNFTGHFITRSYARDLYWLNKAVDDLRAGDVLAAGTDLENMTLMAWGRHVGREAYAEVVEGIACNEHLLWADGFLPVFTDVHEEYAVLKERSPAPARPESLIDSLSKKRDKIYVAITKSASQTGRAFSEAAAILAEVVQAEE